MTGTKTAPCLLLGPLRAVNEILSPDGGMKKGVVGPWMVEQNMQGKQPRMSEDSLSIPFLSLFCILPPVGASGSVAIQVFFICSIELLAVAYICIFHPTKAAHDLGLFIQSH